MRLGDASHPFLGRRKRHFGQPFVDDKRPYLAGTVHLPVCRDAPKAPVPRAWFKGVSRDIKRKFDPFNPLVTAPGEKDGS